MKPSFLTALRDKWVALGDGLKGYRTYLFAACMALLGILDQLDPSMLIGLVGWQNYGFVTMGMSFAVFILRKVTTLPAGKFWRRGERGTEVTEAAPEPTIATPAAPVTDVHAK